MRGYNRCTQLFKQNRRVNDLQLNQPSISLKKLGIEKHLDNKMSVKRADPEVIKWNTAMSNYMRNGQCEIAIDIFNFMPRRSLVSWNTMISGYLRNGKFELARQLFDKMPQRDTVSWNLMINGYVRYRNLNAARLLFEKIPEKDIVSWNSLLSGYARNGYVKEAKELFERMPIKNSISWNGLLAAYVHNGKMDEANMLFDSKKDWDLVSWNCLMGGYVKKMRLADARKIFDRMPERDVVSWNIMISGYALHGDLSQAQKLFEESPSRDVFTWTTMISGFVHHGLLAEGRRAFDMMLEKNAVSWNSMIAGYVQGKKMDLARALFDVMPCKDISSWNTVISGYAQSGDISQARSLFDNMPQRDSISWSAMIAGYAKNGKSEEALRLFVYMIRNGELLNKSVVTCVLSTCADIGMLELGKQVHGCILKTGFDGGTYIGNALLAMYCKCGCIGEARHVFEAIRERDCVSWNTMIAGLAKHGFGKEALVIFGSMAEAGVKPDDVTMVGVLSACSHTGLVDRGRRYFYAMYQDYGIIPNPRHYTCMIDLLGRAGQLEEAQNLVDNMPFEPDAATWGALLGASRIHGNIDLAEKSAKIIFEMDSNNAGMYVLLSNLYAASNRWNDVRKIRLMLWDKGVKKVPGYSWLEVQNKIHVFSVADSVHPDKDRIYALLEELDFCMKRDGYMCTTKLVLHDVDEEEKEHMLKYHSERLAVAFGILTIPTGKPIRVMKNLRVCADCHTAIKHIAKLVGRLIILRDSNRFHHFRGGTCSCGDYW